MRKLTLYNEGMNLVFIMPLQRYQWFAWTGFGLKENTVNSFPENMGHSFLENMSLPPDSIIHILRPRTLHPFILLLHHLGPQIIPTGSANHNWAYRSTLKTQEFGGAIVTGFRALA